MQQSPLVYQMLAGLAIVLLVEIPGTGLWSCALLVRSLPEVLIGLGCWCKRKEKRQRIQLRGVTCRDSQGWLSLVRQCADADLTQVERTPSGTARPDGAKYTVLCPSLLKLIVLPSDLQRPYTCPLPMRTVPRLVKGPVDATRRAYPRCRLGKSAGHGVSLYGVVFVSNLHPERTGTTTCQTGSIDAPARYSLVNPTLR